MPIPSSLGPQVTQSPVRVSTVSHFTPMPKRQPRPNPPVIENLTSSPTSRSATVATVDSKGLSHFYVGGTNDSNNANNIVETFTTSYNSSAGLYKTTPADIKKNLAAVEQRRSGVLGCLSNSSVAGTSGSCSGECDTVKCLENLLVGNLLDQDAKKILCDMAKSTERALKRQIESVGDSLLDAADELSSAQALKAPLNSLNNVLNKLDPGAVAKCLGAQKIIDQAKGQLKKANKVISQAEKGVHDQLADKFNKGTEALQQFSTTPSACSGGGSASLRSLL